MLGKALVVVLMLSLFVFPAVAGAGPFVDPTACTTAAAVQETGVTTYAVTVTGYAKAVRVVEYPVAAIPVVVASLPLGGWTSLFELPGVALDPTKQYQAQVTGGGDWVSSVGCTLVPPPLDVSLASFDATCLTRGDNPRVELTWATLSELHPFFALRRDGLTIATVPATNPGSTQGYSYSYEDTAPLPMPNYEIMYGDEVLNASADCSIPTALTLSTFTARKPNGCLCEDGYYQCRIRGRWVSFWKCG